MAHSDMPFQDIVSGLKVARSSAYVPLVQVMMTTDESGEAQGGVGLGGRVEGRDCSLAHAGSTAADPRSCRQPAAALQLTPPPPPPPPRPADWTPELNLDGCSDPVWLDTDAGHSKTDLTWGVIAKADLSEIFVSVAAAAPCC